MAHKSQITPATSPLLHYLVKHNTANVDATCLIYSC